MSFPVIFIDYANTMAQDNWYTVQRHVPFAHRIAAIGTIEQSVKHVLAQSPTKQCWIVSSHCDYTNFDFNFVPSRYERKYVHVWANNGNKFGETFLFANTEPLDPWDSLMDLPFKFVDSDLTCMWDTVEWASTTAGVVADLAQAAANKQGRVIFKHAGTNVAFNPDSILVDYKPKLVHLEEYAPCFTYLSDASWIREQALMQLDLSSLDDQIQLDAAVRVVNLPVVRTHGSNVLQWLDRACADASGWIIVAHESVKMLDVRIVDIWNTIHTWAQPEALHAFGNTCALVFAVNAEQYRDARLSMETIYDHPCLITHSEVAVQDLRKTVYIHSKDYVKGIEWTPADWGEMLGPVALVRNDILLGVAGDETLIKELELIEEDPWQWPDLRIVKVDARILKRNLFNAKE